MQTEFFMPMVPPTKTHQEKKVRVVNGKPVLYEPAELKAARAKLEAHLAKHIPEKKYTGAIRVMVKWLFPIPEGSKHYDGEWKTTKPDLDNASKLLMDVMTHLSFWSDDCLVASLVVEKFYSKIPGIYVCIKNL